MRLTRAATILLLTLLAGACSDDDASDGTSDAAADVDVETSAPDAAVTDDADADEDADDAVEDAPTDAGPDPGASVFARGCPAPGGALARTLEGDEALEGPNALGGAGDVLLANERAAYVIQGVYEPRRTYWYYGGQPIDAVAIDGCAQAGPERFDEMGIILGAPNLGAFEQSVLRGFRAESVEVIADGTGGGPARVRATGTDDFFWLIELELVKRAFLAEQPRGLSEPMGLEIVVDYTLEPDSPVLRIDVTLINELDRTQNVVAGMVNFFADTTTGTYYNEDRLAFGGLDLALGIPWLASFASDYALTVAMADANAGTINIAGVDALVNVTQFLNGARLGAAGTDRDRRTDTYLMSVASSGPNGAIRPLVDALEAPIPDVAWTLATGSFRVVGVDGDGVAGAEVVIERENLDGDWSPIDGFRTREDGSYDEAIALLSGNRDLRARARTDAFGLSEPVALVVDREATPPAIAPVELVLGAGGTLELDVRDGTGEAIPAKVLLWQDGRVVRRAYAAAAPLTVAAPVGDYELTVSRGFEYEVYDEPLTIAADTTTTLEVTLRRVVDTSGFLSVDGHVHAGPSPDSPIPVPLRALTLAAENVEVAVSTDHEAILPWAPAFEAAGMSRWVRTVLGEEVTPPLPEHSNAYPFPDRSDEAARGVQVDWFGEDLPGVFAASRERGAQVVALNHPRNGCNYMCLIGYDRETGQPTLDDPTLLGFEPDAELWSWDFDTVEYLNGHRGVFVDPDNPDGSGTFDDWMSFLNHGRLITATGVTDVHGLDAGGSPRTYFEAPTDDPAAFEDAMLVDAMLGGRAQVSTGAFAQVAIGDATIGDTATVAGGEVTLDVRIDALPEIDVTAVQVFANCDQVALVEASDPDGVTKFDGAISFAVDADAHVVVVAHGTQQLPRPFPQFDPAGVPRVTTNPIFVDVDGDGSWTAPGGRTCSYERPFDADAKEAHVHEAPPLDAFYGNELAPAPCPCATRDSHTH